MDKLESLKNEDPIIKEIRSIVLKEYKKLKEEALNYGELINKCNHRAEEILFRDKNVGMIAKEVFEKQIKKELGGIKCIPEEN